MRSGLYAALLAGALGAIALTGGAACSKVSEASPGPQPAAAEKQGEPQATGPAVPSLENANYRVELRSAGPCKKGETCGAEVVVESKGDYHINEKYPYKFKLEAPPTGVTYPKPVIGREDGTVGEHKVVLKVPFVGETTGEKKVAGVVSLSVCSAANCLVDRHPLEVTVKVD